MDGSGTNSVYTLRVCNGSRTIILDSIPKSTVGCSSDSVVAMRIVSMEK